MPRLTLIFALTLLCSCGEVASPGVSNPSPSPPGDTCTASGFASQDWTLPQPASNPAPPIASATADGDYLKIVFYQGTPHFQVTLQASAHFTQDPSGNPVNLEGSAGAQILLTGFQGFKPNYTGPKTVTSKGPLMLQVAELGDFEGYVSWGVGVRGPACANVTSSGSTLTFHFIKAPAQ
jgi:hypothetical protein